jgi:[acyl-carrier-protein] S-malonyltransferase
MTRTAVIVCPGRGTYNKAELGYLKRYHVRQADALDAFDATRRSLGQVPLAELDAMARYDASVHTRGDNASALIFTASYFDTLCLDPELKIVAVTGNSMGWYTALAVGSAAKPAQAFEIVNTMGRLMQEHLIGGQTLYPVVDENWQAIPGRREALLARIEAISHRPDHHLALSIDLGGMLVVAGNARGLDAFEAALDPVQGRYPMRLPNHAAFHTPLQAPVAEAGRAVLVETLFDTPKRPLVDGRGYVWWPKTCTAAELRQYTLDTQVVEPYDFTAAIRVAARTFAPDVFVIPGPGNTLGGAVAQALIAINWRGLDSKAAFQERQTSDPVILSMGLEKDRALATGSRG